MTVAQSTALKIHITGQIAGCRNAIFSRWHCRATERMTSGGTGVPVRMACVTARRAMRWRLRGFTLGILRLK